VVPNFLQSPVIMVEDERTHKGDDDLVKQT
jgi:hypothetical protein